MQLPLAYGSARITGYHAFVDARLSLLCRYGRGSSVHSVALRAYGRRPLVGLSAEGSRIWYFVSRYLAGYTPLGRLSVSSVPHCSLVRYVVYDYVVLVALAADRSGRRKPARRRANRSATGSQCAHQSPTSLAGLSQIWGGAAPVEGCHEGLLNKRFTSIACLAFHR
jgi:hypothetical protein